MIGKTGKRLDMNNNLDLMIDEYIKGFSNHVLINGLAEKSDEKKTWEVVKVSKPLTPGPGDCWACFFGSSSNEPLGVKHLLEHMEEKYYVPSLLWTAIVESYKSPGFIWRYISSEAKIGKIDFLENVLKTHFSKRKIDLLDVM